MVDKAMKVRKQKRVRVRGRAGWARGGLGGHVGGWGGGRSGDLICCCGLDQGLTPWKRVSNLSKAETSCALNGENL